MKLTLFALTAVIVMLFAPLAWSGQEEEAAEEEFTVTEWEIPFLNCLTGPIASIGEYLSWSADKAAEEINAGGGINGAPVKIVRLDTGVSPEKATVEMAKIVIAGRLSLEEGNRKIYLEEIV